MILLLKMDSVISLLYFKVAQTRLEKRTQRRNVELCRDIPQYQLCHEVAEIDGSVKALSEKHSVAETALKSLYQDLARVTEDLAIKTKSLALDQRCMEIREKLTDSLNEGPQMITDMSKGQFNPSDASNINARVSSLSVGSQRNQENFAHQLQSFRATSPNLGISNKKNQLLESTYNIDYDETENKRLGDLQRTIGQKTKVIEFA